MPKGQCHCGAVRYEMPAEAIHQALCHCSDCRRHSGAPVVAWGLVQAGSARGRGRDQGSMPRPSMAGGISARPAGRRSSTPTTRSSPARSTSRSARSTIPTRSRPQAQIQVAERIGWMETRARAAGVRALSRLRLSPRRLAAPEFVHRAEQGRLLALERGPGVEVRAWPGRRDGPSGSGRAGGGGRSKASSSRPSESSARPMRGTSKLSSCGWSSRSWMPCSV